jgi:hypothetical protein
LIGIQSINDQSYPFDTNSVRGVSHSGILIEPFSETQLKVVSVDHLDPKGWVPSYMVNLYTSTAGDWLKNL